MTKIEQLKDWIQSSDNIVFFGGAGVSTESGIPDFRGTNGLYRQGGIKVENMTIGLGQDGYILYLDTALSIQTGSTPQIWNTTFC